ncbi:MAG: cyclic nucleotide-binding domain-containing protein [Pseudomonadales bacterium]
MGTIDLITPATGSRLAVSGEHTLVFGQPPEVLKGMKRCGHEHFTGLVLIDTRERDGSLMNHVEFLLYHFLFTLNGHASGEKIALIGDAQAIRQLKRLLKITLLGPDLSQLEQWDIDPELTREWLAVSNHAALKAPSGQQLCVDDFFQDYPFKADAVDLGPLRVEHSGFDQYRIIHQDEVLELDLNQDIRILPSYETLKDHNASELSKFSLEVLGGASGFSPNEPCTGLALSHNGEYLLIDSIPFLDEHLMARGISKNQISACFLTHIHDDHCALFPLMQAAHPIEIITSRTIFEMAMEKLALGLGWKESVIREHFIHVDIQPGRLLNHFGLIIEAHHTVHSIPTIGATFSVKEGNTDRKICVVGDNHSLAQVSALFDSGVVRASTLENLRRLYEEPYELLIADGGAGALHGDPAEFAASPADRIVFVHIDELPTEFSATFSVARAGKRFRLIEGDLSLYSMLMFRYLKQWIRDDAPDRWLRGLVTNSEVLRYNLDDVILVQGQESKNYVYLILTGYCSVIHHDGKQLNSIAMLQAGDLLGEMAVLTDLGVRNASIIARTPVAICRFSADTFTALADNEMFKAELKKRWTLRPLIKSLPQFESVSSTVVEKIAAIATLKVMDAGENIAINDDVMLLKLDGGIESSDPALKDAQNLGFRPFQDALCGEIRTTTPCRFLAIERADFESTRLSCPQLNYQLRKRHTQTDHHASWQLQI